MPVVELTAKCNTQAKGRRLRLGALAVLLIVAVAAGVGLAVQQRRLPKRFSVVEAGVLYRSSQPSPAQLENLIVDQGIKTILIARESSSQRVVDELEAAGKLGLRIEQIPIASRQPITDEQVEQFFKTVDDPANRPVLVHCSMGRHRTGYLCGLYRIERQGWSLERAMDEMMSFCPKGDASHPMVEQLRQYKPRGGAWRESSSGK